MLDKVQETIYETASECIGSRDLPGERDKGDNVDFLLFSLLSVFFFKIAISFSFLMLFA